MSEMIAPTQMNFIVAKLGDNDFGWKLKNALEEGVNNYGYDAKLCPRLWKKYLIAYLLGHALKSRIELSDTEEFDYVKLKELEDYLRSRLTVTYERFAPTADDDGGSACIDLATKVSWIY